MYRTRLSTKAGSVRRVASLRRSCWHICAVAWSCAGGAYQQQPARREGKSSMRCRSAKVRRRLKIAPFPRPAGSRDRRGFLCERGCLGRMPFELPGACVRPWARSGAAGGRHIRPHPAGSGQLWRRGRALPAGGNPVDCLWPRRYRARPQARRVHHLKRVTRSPRHGSGAGQQAVGLIAA